MAPHAQLGLSLTLSIGCSMSGKLRSRARMGKILVGSSDFELYLVPPPFSIQSLLIYFLSFLFFLFKD